MWFLLIFLVLPWLYIWGQSITSRHRKLPPGPTRWPIIGSIPQMLLIDTAYPYKQIFGLAKKYGPIMSVGLGTQFTVVLNSSELMKDLFKRPEGLIRFQSAYSRIRNKGQNLGLIFANGKTWKETRKITVKGLRDFGFGKTRSMEETFKEEVDLLLADIREEILTTGGVWSVDANRLAIIAINLVWSSVGGYRFDHSSNIIKEHIKLMTATFKTLSSVNLLLLFPFLQVFPELSGFNQIEKITRDSENFMKELVEDVRFRRQGRVEAESFIEAFLDEIQENKNNPATEVTENQLITILMDLFLAGSETTGVAINWLIFYFARDQRIQDKAREELRLASKSWTKVLTIVEASRLPYLRACIYETMRHSPFAAVSIPRVAHTDIDIGGYRIPEGSLFIFNIYGAFQEKSIWGENVDDFAPERFLNADGNAIDLNILDHFIQFGFAPRHCPGEALAFSTLIAVALMLLTNFRIGLVVGREAKLEFSPPSSSVGPKAYVVKLEPIGP